MGKEKSRNFTFLLYPDRKVFLMIGKNVWKKSECRLQLVHFMIKIKTEKNGGVKKRHYHGIYIANNPVTADAVRRKIKAVLSSEDIECKAVARFK